MKNLVITLYISILCILPAQAELIHDNTCDTVVNKTNVHIDKSAIVYIDRQRNIVYDLHQGWYKQVQVGDTYLHPGQGYTISDDGQLALSNFALHRMFVTVPELKVLIGNKENAKLFNRLLYSAVLQAECYNIPLTFEDGAEVDEIQESTIANIQFRPSFGSWYSGEHKTILPLPIVFKPD